MVQYKVSSLEDLLKVIIPHFDKYPLISQKFADYQLFKQAVEMVYRQEHLIIEGLKRIVAIRASINKGLTERLKSAFPNTKPVNRPIVEFKGIPDPNWLAGFTEGEGLLLY